MAADRGDSDEVKQPEVNRLVCDLTRQLAKRVGWKSKSNFLYKKQERLFFDVGILGRARTARLSLAMRYKLYDFDSTFWNIVGMPENAKRPLSFHADGAWTAPTMSIWETALEHVDWHTERLLAQLEPLLREANLEASSLARKIQSADDNLAYLEECHARILKRFPRTEIQLHRERLLTAILKQDFTAAKKIAAERVLREDTGGFSVGAKSFYVLAREYLERGTSGSSPK